MGFGIWDLGLGSQTRRNLDETQDSSHASKTPRNRDPALQFQQNPKPKAEIIQNTKPAYQGWLLTSKPNPRQMPSGIQGSSQAMHMTLAFGKSQPGFGANPKRVCWYWVSEANHKTSKAQRWFIGNSHFGNEKWDLRKPNEF